MGLIGALEGVPRRKLMVFLVVDKSASMYGSRVKALNKYIHDFISYLKVSEEENPDLQISISVLEFSTDFNWMHDKPLLINDFFWKEISPDGLTNFGKACTELNRKLTRNGGVMQSPAGMYAPVLILISDGSPTDDYEIGLELLENNNWYKYAHRLFIGIGNDVDSQFVYEFTKDEKNSVIVRNSTEMKHVFKCLAQYVAQSLFGNNTHFSDLIEQNDMTDEKEYIYSVLSSMTGSNYAAIWAISRHRIHTDGHGVTSLVALSGCDLSCKYCINPTCKSNNAFSLYTPTDLYNELKIDRLYFEATDGGITFGGGEPCFHYKFIKSFNDICNWKITIESSLNVPNYIIKELSEIVDFWIIDIKDMNPVIYKKYTGKNNRKVLENLEWLATHNLQDRCVIRIPRIPEYNNTNNQKDSAEKVKSLGFNNIELFDYVIKKNDKSYSLDSSSFSSDEVEWDETGLEGWV